jgi:hypothetical protein
MPRRRKGDCGVEVGRPLFVEIDLLGIRLAGRTARRRRDLSGLDLPQAPGGQWDFVQLLDSFRVPAVGGISFSPLPLLGFVELLAESVVATAASVS